jgi:hypothetical protein
MRERDRERECRAETRIEAAARRSACPSPSACHAAPLVLALSCNLGAPCCSLLLLAAPCCSLLLLAAPCCSLPLLGAPWCSLVLLGAPWCSLVLLAALLSWRSPETFAPLARHSVPLPPLVRLRLYRGSSHPCSPCSPAFIIYLSIYLSIYLHPVQP